MKIIFSLLIALISTTAVIGQSADDILGVWYNQEKTGKVEVFKKGDKYFGKIIWLKEPMRDGAPKLDIENSDEKLRTQPIMGLEILKGFEFDDDEWEE